MKRSDGRRNDELRPLKITHNVFNYAAGSVQLELGKTKVLCAITLQNNVPSFLKGKKTGWLTAEYAMLPTSTHQRIERVSATRRHGRYVEISRLIGRCLRTVVNLDVLGERTIIIDCDVLQADGGTRTACITGAYIALKKAEERWLNSRIIKEPVLKEEIAAISAGIIQNTPLLDLNFVEDSSTDADVNFVLTRSGNIIEIQGSAEKNPLLPEQFQQLHIVAKKGIDDLFSFIDGKQKKKRVSPFNKIRIKSTEHSV